MTHQLEGERKDLQEKDNLPILELIIEESTVLVLKYLPVDHRQPSQHHNSSKPMSVDVPIASMELQVSSQYTRSRYIFRHVNHVATYVAYMNC